jgi:hypothetical protein
MSKRWAGRSTTAWRRNRVIVLDRDGNRCQLQPPRIGATCTTRPRPGVLRARGPPRGWRRRGAVLVVNDRLVAICGAKASRSAPAHGSDTCRATRANANSLPVNSRV